MVFESKKALRRSIKQQTLSLSTAERERQASLVTSFLVAAIQQRSNPTVALFAPLSDEIPITIDELAPYCRIILPKVDTSANSPLMEFYPYTPESLLSGAYGINEPTSQLAVSAKDIDIAIIPGVAFTRNGYRLGRGKGYYDCYLSRNEFRAETIGICFDHQLLDTLPQEPHDRCVNMVITASIIEQNR